MDTSQAFEILGLAQTASEKEIDARHRELSLKCHPDTGGTEEKMKKLNQARDVALAPENKMLIPLSAFKELIETNKNIMEAQQRQETTKKVVNNIILCYANKYKKIKDMPRL